MPKIYELKSNKVSAKQCTLGARQDFIEWLEEHLPSVSYSDDYIEIYTNRCEEIHIGDWVVIGAETTEVLCNEIFKAKYQLSSIN